jgi:hypothetical protein
LPAFSFGEVKENADGQLQISNIRSYTVKSIIDHKNNAGSPQISVKKQLVLPGGAEPRPYQGFT